MSDANDWREISRDLRADSPFLRVYCERIATPTRPNGVDWMVVRRKQATVVAPRTPEGNFLLVRQERIPVRRLMWEFPAGQIDGEVNESTILETAHRELGEETGCRAEGEMIPLGFYFPRRDSPTSSAIFFLRPMWFRETRGMPTMSGNPSSNAERFHPMSCDG